MIYMKEEFILDDETTSIFYLFIYKYLQISSWRRSTRCSTPEEYKIPNNKQRNKTGCSSSPPFNRLNKQKSNTTASAYLQVKYAVHGSYCQPVEIILRQTFSRIQRKSSAFIGTKYLKML